MKDKWIKDIYICDDCAKKHGAVDCHDTTFAKISTCKYCQTKGVVLLRLYDYSWPLDESLDQYAKNNRPLD